MAWYKDAVGLSVPGCPTNLDYGRAVGVRWMGRNIGDWAFKPSI